MAKRSKTVQKLVDTYNEILAQRNVYTLEHGEWQWVSSNSNEGQCYKDGIAAAMEFVLRISKSYEGYIYLELDENNNATDKFMRKYF